MLALDTDQVREAAGAPDPKLAFEVTNRNRCGSSRRRVRNPRRIRHRTDACAAS